MAIILVIYFGFEKTLQNYPACHLCFDFDPDPEAEAGTETGRHV